MENNNTINVLKNQLSSVIDLVQEEDPWLYAVMEPATSEMHNLLLIPGNITSERLQKYKGTLHTLDTVIAGMDDHIGDEVIDHTKLWSFLYSLYDMLLSQLDEDNNSEFREEE
jgi:hypothetical protein